LYELNENKNKYQIVLPLIESLGDVIGKKLLAFPGKQGMFVDLHR
jgi:hypothetical protein